MDESIGRFYGNFIYFFEHLSLNKLLNFHFVIKYKKYI